MENVVTPPPDGSVLRDGWRRATASIPNNQCVEVRPDPKIISVRDSKGHHDIQLRFGHTSWGAFLSLLRP
jgi:hypothetical protein